jgi:NTP pyrophosphatase (non-canonical NTP hydrolase)
MQKESPQIQFEKVQNLVVRQNEHITIFNNGSTEQVAEWLQEEITELKEVLEKKEFDKIELESEIGDVAYLLIRMSQMTGIDLIEAVLSKVARNYQKYGKAESREQAKKDWGDKDHEYLDNWTKAFREKQDKKKQLTNNNS